MCIVALLVEVGGAVRGGIVVRRGHDFGSTLLNSRLGHGSLVQQVSLIHGRLPLDVRSRFLFLLSSKGLYTACSSAQALRSLCKHGRRYVKISGEGPDHGWVSLRVGSKQLLRHVDAA